MLAQYGVEREGLPGDWPTGYDDPSVPATPAWQEEHTSVPAAQVARLAREWAQNAIDTNGRWHDPARRRNQPLVPQRPDLSGVPRPHDDHRQPGPQRRRLGALRGPGEDPPHHGLPAHGLRPGLGPPAAAHEPDGVLVRRTPTSAATTPSPPTTWTPAQGCSPARASWTCSRSRSDSAGPELPHLRPQLARPRRRRSGRRHGGARQYSRTQLKEGNLHFAVEDPEAADNYPRILSCGARTSSAARPRATSTSCATCSAPTAPPRAAEAAPDAATARSAGATSPSRASSTCS